MLSNARKSKLKSFISALALLPGGRRAQTWSLQTKLSNVSVMRGKVQACFRYRRLLGLSAERRIKQEDVISNRCISRKNNGKSSIDWRHFSCAPGP